MRLRQVAIKNFRILKDVSFPAWDQTVIIGENDAGKTAIVDALKIALGRGPLGRQSPFEESDYHVESPSETPRDSPGIEITLWFREDRVDEWPETVKMALAEIIQTHPVSGLDSIGLRLSSSIDSESSEAIVSWDFLDVGGTPLTGRGASPVWFTRFLGYLVFQHLPALRDPQHEFSIRSRIWGRILKQITFSAADRARLEAAANALNDLLVSSDPMFAKLIGTITRVSDVVPLHDSDPVTIRAAPSEPWELLARSELAIRGRGSPVQISLLKHGLGLQSLAVLFLLEAYVELGLRQEYHPDTEALVAIEEPEAHLHPQAVLAFARYTRAQHFQLIITSHSPYFLATAPLASTVFLRSRGAYSEARYISRSYSCKGPKSTGIVSMCAARPERWSYDVTNGVLTLRGAMQDHELRSLEALAGGDAVAKAEIGRMFSVSQAFLSDEELTKLSEWAGRTRGHVFFARSWLLCEGPGDLIILQSLSELLGKSLDSSGVSVIDYCNYGSVGPFVALAENLEIPWIVTSDGDPAGMSYAATAREKGFGEPDLARRVRPLEPAGIVIETALVRSNLKPTVSLAAAALGFSHPGGPAAADYDDRLTEFILTRKDMFPHEFRRLLKQSSQKPADVPAYFVETIELAIALAA